MKKLKKLFIVALSLLVYLSGLAPVGVMTAYAQASDCNDLPGLELTQSVPSTNTYSLWVLAKKETPTIKSYVRIDDGACQQVQFPSAGGWEWVSGTQGIIKQSIKGGQHTFKFSVDGGAFLIDKILLSSDINCKPVDTGQNCIEEPIDFVIEGIEQGSTITGDRRVSASLTVPTNDAVKMEFLLDGKSIGTQLQAPYCLLGDANGACGLYNFSALSQGKHTLGVNASTKGGQLVSKSVEFTVGSTNSLPPSMSNDQQVDVSKLPDNIVISVEGIKNNETVSGRRLVQAKVSGATAAPTVMFALAGIDMNSSSTAPYCLVQKDAACAEWDSTTIVNGKYILYVRATAAGSKPKELQVPFTVSNSALAATGYAIDKEVIVGNPNQQVSGNVKVSISETKLKQLSPGTTITYEVDGTKVATTTTANPSIELDTSKYSNKNHTISARLTAVNGESTTITSEVAIQNGILVGTASWFRENIYAAVAIGLAAGVGLYIVIRFVSGRLKYKKLLRQHNMLNDYASTVTHPRNHRVGYAMASVVTVFTVGIFIFRLGASQAGVGVGFVAEVEDGKSSQGFNGLSLGYENNMTLAFARISYARPVSSTQAPTTPSPAANGDGFAVNTASTGFEAETMSLASGLGYANADVSAHGALSLLIWGNGSAYKSINSGAIKGVTVRARGDQCNGAPIMMLKIDNSIVMTTTVANSTWSDFSVPLNLPSGSHAFEIAFTNDENTSCDRNLYVDSVGLSTSTIASTITTPTITPTPTPAPTPAPSAPVQQHTGTMQHNGAGPMIDNSKIPAPVAGMNGPVLYYNTGYVPFADDIGAFRTDCTVSHITYDDPIVFPGRPGAAHLHTFFGNTGVNAFSTKESIETTGNSTCNGGTLNRTGYWMPTVIDANGAPVMPVRVLVYYKTSYYGVSAQSVVAPPAGLRMIAGTSTSTTVQGRDPYGHSISSFACNSESFPYPVVTGGTSIDTFCPVGARQFFMEIRFPQCWDGVNLDSYDHKSHMAYPTGYGCPASHPVGIPEVQLRVQYDYYADRSAWRLSSDSYTNGPGGYSSHADWYNGWDRNILQSILQNCWNAQRDCQVDNIGNGQKLGRR